MQFLDPKTDIAFKKLFGDEHRKNLTISFLNSVLERKEGNLITDVTFQDTANLPETMDKKRSFVDINCKDQENNNYIVEMQIAFQKNFLPRSQYYASLVLSRQLKVKARYGNLLPVVFVAVVDHILFKNHKNVISHHVITDTKTHDVQLKHLEFHYIELPKFKKNVDELKTVVDKWLYFMRDADSTKVIPQSLQSKEFQEAFHVLESSQWNQADLDAYVAEMDELGREERITEGALERGLEQGLEQGAQKKAEAMALKLLKKKTDIAEIADLTDLSIDQIKMLQAKLQK